MRAAVVVNREAGGGMIRARWPGAVRMLKERLGPVEVRFTQGPGHAREIARELVGARYEMVIAAGGDGTVNEVLNGMLAEGGEAALGVLPLASGGDLARSLGLKGPRQAVAALVAGETQWVDAIRVKYQCAKVEQERCCLNAASVGLGGEVAREIQGRWRVLPGRVRYLAVAVRQLASCPGYDLRMSVDGAKTQEWAVTTLALANGRYQGGGMLIAPRARMNDGRMDITVVERITLREAAPQLHLLYTGGVYGHPKAHHLRAARVRLEADAEVPLEIDGEAVGTLPLEAEVAPAVVRLVCPAGAIL